MIKFQLVLRNASGCELDRLTIDGHFDTDSHMTPLAYVGAIQRAVWMLTEGDTITVEAVHS